MLGKCRAYPTAKKPITAEYQNRMHVSLRFKLRYYDATCFNAHLVRRSQFVENVGYVPAAVDDPDNLDHAWTLAVENKIVTVREQP